MEDARIHKSARVLFDSEPHTEVARLYRSEGKTLTFDNAPRPLRQQYIKRAERIAVEFEKVYS